jgi:hypothetical protein
MSFVSPGFELIQIMSTPWSKILNVRLIKKIKIHYLPLILKTALGTIARKHAGVIKSFINLFPHKLLVSSQVYTRKIIPIIIV